MILEQGVKKVSVETIFTREALNPQTLKTTFGFFQQTVTFEIWNQPEFECYSLTKLLGHSGFEHERMIRIYLNKKCPDRIISQELDFHSETNGVRITVSTEKRITKARAFELIKNSQVRVFDNENRVLSQVAH